ncbi:acetyl-CoA carboxylase biotin carboxyl carrier protein subunit [Intestinibaculum porci]|uniref:Biotin carboxyl carrier protein of acetyl-CoA carboxylase n=1 Tax=Intestinibaculum porci TaxID=2487118 RepID=A0A3G9J207_9FIRM|nr:acetyl-CoA carboxylase biotin carboxyl carrier protein [Intestinibaculum porci]BBH25210.1 acetyl-CoA carboxylase biotin carboxyl carrier protein subunit [Intestinibaculum porci]
MDLVKELMTAFEQADISKMKIEMEGIKLELEKATAPVAPTAPVMPVNTPAAPMPAVPASEEKAAGTEVKSPLVGTFYDAPSPEAQPFVKVGDQVAQGDTLCIIEAMKVMNEIKAPCDGTIASISAHSEDLVEYDQTLMVIA